MAASSRREWLDLDHGASDRTAVKGERLEALRVLNAEGRRGRPQVVEAAQQFPVRDIASKRVRPKRFRVSCTYFVSTLALRA